MKTSKMPLHCLKCLGLFIVLLFGTNILFAQSNMTSITAQQAASEVATQQVSYGFSQVYFETSDINRLISSDDIAGIRFYTAQSEGMNLQTVIAVAVRNDNREAGFYIRMDGLSGTFLTQGEARSDAQRSKDGSFTSLAVTVSKTDMSNIMASPGSTGIHIKPGLNEVNTMIVAPAVKSGEFTMDMGSNYFRNEAPCPNNCGGDFLINLE